MKGRFLRKLKSISTITTPKQSLIFQVNPSSQPFQASPLHKEQEHKSNHLDQISGNSSISKVFNNVKDEEMDSSFNDGFGESRRPSTKSEDTMPAKNEAECGSNNVHTIPFSATHLPEESQACEFQLDPSLEIDTPSLQQPNANSESLLRAEPLVSVEPIVIMDSEEPPELSDFEEKCPPGGSESVILYTTSLRGIRKTFEDCNTIRFLLGSFGVVFEERDVSMHLEFREELWRIMGGRTIPPGLFIRGRHIGGASEVVGLHEQGKLRELLQGIPLKTSRRPCTGCAGVRFVLCSNCKGSCKVILIPEGQGRELSIRCPECNENGLVKCPVCC